jgi:tetratricopeptide (TPR) repeat protein
VAALADLPVDPHMKGNVIRAAFSDLPRPKSQDLFGTVAVRRVAAQATSAKDASEYAQRLKALGYLSGGEPEKLAPTGGERPGVTEGGWNNLGVYFRETGVFPQAEAAFQKALALRPTYASPVFNLAVLYRERGEDRKAIDWMFRSLAAGHADPEGTVLRWFSEYHDRGKTGEAREMLERGARAYPANETIARELGLMRFKSKDCSGAWDAVARFAAATREPDTLNALGLFQTCLGKREEAIALFEKSLGLKSAQPAVVQALNLLKQAPPSGP